ncbi:MAG: hypothetical protein ACYCSA_10010 [Thermoplasmataceae archaeon]
MINRTDLVYRPGRSSLEMPVPTVTRSGFFGEFPSVSAQESLKNL